MELALTLAPGHEPLRLLVNGALVAEVAVGVTQDATSLAAEVDRARVLERLSWLVQEWQRHLLVVQELPDHTDKTAAARQESFCRGLKDGLCERTTPHPYAGVPATQPQFTRAYGTGYADGAALACCLRLLGEARP